jgi:hypothetical protein
MHRELAELGDVRPVAGGLRLGERDDADDAPVQAARKVSPRPIRMAVVAVP